MALILLPIPNKPVNVVKVGCLVFICVYTLLDKSVILEYTLFDKSVNDELL